MNRPSLFMNRAHGSATLQLILVMPFLLLILLGGLDLGRVVLAKIALASAVHVGVLEGARVIQLKDADAVWQFDPESKTIVFDKKSDIIEAMEKIAKADICVKKGKEKCDEILSFDNQTKVMCRCLKTTAAGIVDYSELVACDDSIIQSCVPTSGYANAARQIQVAMEPKMSVETIFYWPFVNKQIVLSTSANMRGDEYVEYFP